MTDIVRFKDFSMSEEPVTFKIGEDTFLCVPEIPLDSLVELATLGAGASGGAQIEKIKDFFDGIMDPDSAAQFRKRCEKKAPKAIGMRHITPLLSWLMEVYGLRPTQPSDESDTGSRDDDTSSTDGVLVTG